jgi:alkanesulfonate monooxygenase SsuD/methylene tetrahydromethanopterin reductase-like flavin-dependent oxidoreductase (luciferase family)
MRAVRQINGVGIWSGQLRYGDAGEVAEAAAELEALGYSALWIPDIGGDVFGAVERLMRATASATIATGILNLWMHPPGEAAEAHDRLTRTYGDRFLVGIGVSHPPLIDADEPGRRQHRRAAAGHRPPDTPRKCMPAHRAGRGMFRALETWVHP